LAFGWLPLSAGVGADYYNIGVSSAAFGASGFANNSDDTALTVMDILKRTNANASNGTLWGVSKTINGKTYISQELRSTASDVFSGINETVDIV
jgi:hypothetical protein